MVENGWRWLTPSNGSAVKHGSSSSLDSASTLLAHTLHGKVPGGETSSAAPTCWGYPLSEQILPQPRARSNSINYSNLIIEPLPKSFPKRAGIDRWIDSSNIQWIIYKYLLSIHNNPYLPSKSLSIEFCSLQIFTSVQPAKFWMAHAVEPVPKPMTMPLPQLDRSLYSCVVSLVSCDCPISCSCNIHTIESTADICLRWQISVSFLEDLQ